MSVRSVSAKHRRSYSRRRRNKRGPRARNPADVRAGIDASRIGMGRRAQRTGTLEEIERRKGVTTPLYLSKASQDRMRITRQQAKLKEKKQTTPTLITPHTQQQGVSVTPSFPPVAENTAPQEKHYRKEAVTQGLLKGPTANSILINQDLFDPDRLLQDAGQLNVPEGYVEYGPVETPENFWRDVAIATAVGGTAIIGGALMTTAVTSAAAGGAIKSTAGIATNTVTAAKSASWLSKVVGAVSKHATITLAMIGASIGTYPWADWAEAEGIDSLTFAQRQAQEDGNLELAEEIHAILLDVTNPDIWDKILHAIPMINVIKATEKKVLGNIQMDKALTEKRRQAQKGEFTPDPERLAEEARQDARWKAIHEANKKRKLEEEARQDERWARIRGEAS